jgi:MYXO-CTERM domain-containing protein
MRKIFLALLLPSVAHAFCGFYVSGADAKLYNNATQVVLMRDGARTVLSMENNYQGPPENFAMVVPVPVVLQKDNVKTLSRDIFDKVDTLDAPRLVEYWEMDPCKPIPHPHYDRRPMSAVEGAVPAPSPQHFGVKIEAQFTVGEYEIVILSASDSTGLDGWLKSAGYHIPDGAEPFLRPYVAAGSKFFVAKVDVSKVKMDNGQAMLSPLRFFYDAEQFSLPIRLGLANANGPQDLIVHILARGKRYEVANYDDVTIPTNLDVSEDTKSQYATFYAALFDATLAKHPKAVVTEYAWDSSSCDPCPTPPLDGSALATLGADALPSMSGHTDELQYGGGFVLTRLHARYTKDTLGDDLVFREAKPIVGGRGVPGENAKLDQGAADSSDNNFQGRYIIKHPWTGPIACQNPVRDRWGGPPGWVEGQPIPSSPAKNTAFAPRGGNVSLASFLKGPVADMAVIEPPPPPATQPASSALAPPPPPVAPPSKARGCSCEIGGHGAAGVSGGALVLISALAFTRLRRRRPHA